MCKYLPRAQEGKEKKARTKTNQHYPVRASCISEGEMCNNINNRTKDRREETSKIYTKKSFQKTRKNLKRSVLRKNYSRSRRRVWGMGRDCATRHAHINSAYRGRILELRGQRARCKRHVKYAEIITFPIRQKPHPSVNVLLATQLK